MCHGILLAHGLYAQSVAQYQTKLGSAYTKAYDFLYTHKDSAYLYLEKSKDIAQEYHNWEDILDIQLVILNCSGYHHDLKHYMANLKKFHSLLSSAMADTAVIDTTYYLNRHLLEKGLYEYLVKNYTQSEKHLLQLEEKLKSISTNDLDFHNLNMYRTATIYLGALYKNTGKYATALKFYKKHNNMCLANKDKLQNWEKHYYNTKRLIAKLYQIRGDYDSADSTVTEVIEFYKATPLPVYKNALNVSYFLKAEILMANGNHKAALNVLDECDIGPNIELESNKLVLLGDIHNASKNRKMAYMEYQNALALTDDLYDGNRHQNRASIYLKIGDLYLNDNDPYNALKHYQIALINGSKEFSNEDPFTNPEPSMVFSKLQLLEILLKKLKVYNTLLQKRRQDQLIPAAKNATDLIIKCLDEIRLEFHDNADKKSLLNNIYSACNEMLLFATYAKELTNNGQYTLDAFYFTEKSRSILLLEALRSINTPSFVGVPDSIAHTEFQFRSSIAHLEKKYYHSKDSIKRTWNDSLLNVSRKYHDFLESVKRHFPKYYNFKYGGQTIAPKALQNHMQPDEKIVIYRQTESQLFTLVISKTDIALFSTPFGLQNQEQLSTYIKMLNAPNVDNIKNWKTLGRALFDNLLQPIMGNGLPQQLTIIADGNLAYLPFQSLIDKTGKPLLYSTAVRYASSCTALIQKNKLQHAKASKELLAIIPSFGSNGVALSHTDQEAKNISTYFQVKVLKGEHATKEEFTRQVANNYGIIHFATHAHLNHTHPDYSNLSFTNNVTKDDPLYIKDLYNMVLNTKMVTLSACDSGIGKELKGEGLISLARGFQYAGAPSVTTTLWKVDDRSSSEIMGLYYKYLAKGTQKSKALQLAKLEFLNSAIEPELQHPYFWAGYIVIGANDAVTTSTNWWPYIILAILLVLTLIFKINPRFRAVWQRLHG